jgi:hypothetical protein
MITTLIVSLIAALIGAIVGAYLQKRWTPDYSAELSALAQQIAALKKQHETVDQERAETEHLRLNLALEQGYSGNYIVRVENNSNREITVEKIALRKDAVWLCELCKPKTNDGSLQVPANSSRHMDLAPQHNPSSTLQSMKPDLPSGKCIDVELVMDFRVFGRPRQFSKGILVTANYRNDHLTQYSP